MKTIIQALKLRSLLVLALLLTLLAKPGRVSAQLPDCVSGNTAYTVFNDSISSAWSSTLDSIEIRSVNLLTGAVGPLMGNRRYWVRKYDGTGSTSNNSNYIYGSSALAVDFATNRFYVMTQMSAAMAKDIFTINPLTGNMTMIGTTPSSLDGYHFVKMSSANNGWVYAIGVHRDSTTAANLVNPLIRFQTCGLTPSTNCATGTIQILGYLPTTPLMYKWKLFNGDIAFDVSGNLYFATAAYEPVGGNGRYTDSRLFRINAADLPTSSGSGIIPMTLIADYDGLDSTVINGVGFNGSGTLFMTTRRYLGAQNTPLPPFRSELYRSTYPGSSAIMPAFAPPTAGTSASDLATCYFPAAILSQTKLLLNGQLISNSSNLRWETNINHEVQYFEVQRSSDGVNFETVSRVEVMNVDQQEQRYSFTDNSADNSKPRFYRIREFLSTGGRFYSNIVKINAGKISLSGKVKPNPFVNSFEVSVNLRAATSVDMRIIDQTGRVFYQRTLTGNTGENKLVISEVSRLKPGIYFFEAKVDNESVREKIVKQ